ncbi:fido domain-containing protein [Paraphysoderma sedebokerense]|nr:fido domain-containing protein [Paraphysoderma sedebokerense]
MSILPPDKKGKRFFCGEEKILDLNVLILILHLDDLAWEKSVRTCHVPWDPARQWKEEVQALGSKVISFEKCSYFDEFSKLQMALTILDANRLEGTIPENHREGATLELILKFLNSTEKEPENIAWPVEGGRETKSTDRQLFQFAQAAQYLLQQKISSPLSLDLIVETHKIMMNNSYNDDRQSVTVGRVRGAGEEIYAGHYQFIPGSRVKNAVEWLIREYQTFDRHPISKATYLFYELITIHPFINANGRLCRLFLAWSLMRDGFPFPISFSSGHKNRRQHHMNAIDRARQPYEGHRGELNDILIVSMSRVLSNYLENTRLLEGRCRHPDHEE